MLINLAVKSKYDLEIRDYIINNEEDNMNTTEDSPLNKVLS